MIDENILYLTPFGSDLFVRFLNEKCDMTLKDFSERSNINYNNLCRIFKSNKAFLYEKNLDKIVKTFEYEDKDFTVFNSFYNIMEDIKEWMHEEGVAFTVGERIKFQKEDSIVFTFYINDKFGITLEKFAQKTEISLSTLKKILYGEMRYFNENTMKKITTFLGFNYKKISVFDNFRVMMIEIYRYYAINKLKKRRGEIFSMEEIK